MSNGAYTSTNMVQLDAAWRRFVACDPELSQLENEKAEIYRRHAVKENARQKRAERLRAWRDNVAQVVTAAFIDVMTVFAFMALLHLA